MHRPNWECLCVFHLHDTFTQPLSDLHSFGSSWRALLCLPANGEDGSSAVDGIGRADNLVGIALYMV